jgi:hypothetical protein
MFYHAYKLQMSKDATNALNSSGSWTAHPEAKVYAALRCGLRNGDAMPEAMRAMCDNVMSAALMGIYHHGLTVEADDLEQVFAYDNAGHAPAMSIRYIIAQACPSLSVGDVVVCQDGIYICSSMGWTNLPKEAALGFAVMARDIAYERPNALEDVA